MNINIPLCESCARFVPKENGEGRGRLRNAMRRCKVCAPQLPRLELARGMEKARVKK